MSRVLNSTGAARDRSRRAERSGGALPSTSPRRHAQRTRATRLTPSSPPPPFRAWEPQHSASVTIPLPRATADTLELLRAAASALRRIYRPGYSYHKLGVILGAFTPDALRQGELFGDDALTPDVGEEARGERHERGEALMRALDAINARFGRDMIRPLSAGIAQPWRMKQARRSPRYTTRWDELPEAR